MWQNNNNKTGGMVFQKGDVTLITEIRKINMLRNRNQTHYISGLDVNEHDYE